MDLLNRFAAITARGNVTDRNAAEPAGIPHALPPLTSSEPNHRPSGIG
jgi:hypothetical protein